MVRPYAMVWRAPLVAAALIAIGTSVRATDVTRESFSSGGRARTYHLFVPDRAPDNGPAPLLVLLHGTDEDGQSLVDLWKPLAKKHGIILVGPDALSAAGWRVRDDGPDHVHDLVERLRARYDVDPRRIYLFGHSGGAAWALALGLLESEYFAAVAAHAGVLHSGMYPLIDTAPRKTPMAIWVGTEDPLVPLPVARATRDALNRRGFNLQLTEIVGHAHSYLEIEQEITSEAWTFLENIQLAAAPKHQPYY